MLELLRCAHDNCAVIGNYKPTSSTTGGDCDLSCKYCAKDKRDAPFVVGLVLKPIRPRNPVLQQVPTDGRVTVIEDKPIIALEGHA